MSRYNPDTTALRAQINTISYPPRMTFRYIDVTAQVNRCRRRIYGLDNNTIIPGGHILSAVTVGGPSGPACIVTFSRNFAASWTPDNRWQLASVNEAHTTGPLEVILNSVNSIEVDIDGTWDQYPGPWSIRPLSVNAVEFDDGGNLESLDPFTIEDSTRSTQYNVGIEEVGWNNQYDFTFNFISDSPSNGAYLSTDFSDDLVWWTDFQIMNENGTYDSPTALIAGGATGNTSVTLRYPGPFSPNQGYPEPNLFRLFRIS